MQIKKLLLIKNIIKKLHQINQNLNKCIELKIILKKDENDT